MAIVKNIIDQHLDEASFKWLIRDGAVNAPHYNLADLAELDTYIEANFDGLRISGEEGWEIVRQTMSTKGPGEIFTAGVLAFETQIPERIEAVLATVEPEEELQRALISALGWINFEIIEAKVQEMLSSDKPFLRYLGLGACAAHRRQPAVHLEQLLEDESPLVRARAIKAAGELGLLELLPLVQKELTNSDEKCRYYAAWTTVLLRGNGASSVLRDIIKNKTTFVEEACAIALRGMPLHESHVLLKDLLKKDGFQRLVAYGAGIVGDPVFIPWLLEIMKIPEVSRVAGESFSMIAGVDLAYDDLEGEWPEGFESGATEDPDDEDVEMDKDENLPWPDVDLLTKWWNEHQSEFYTGMRYLVGKTITVENLQQVLKTGYQRQRTAATLELGLMLPGSPLFNVRAPGWRQQKY